MKVDLLLLYQHRMVKTHKSTKMLSRSRAVALGIILGLGLFAIYILFNSQHINSAEELSKKVQMMK